MYYTFAHFLADFVKFDAGLEALDFVCMLKLISRLIFGSLGM